MGAGLVEVPQIQMHGLAIEAVAKIVLCLDDDAADQRFLEELENSLDGDRADDHRQNDGNALEAIVGKQDLDPLEDEVQKRVVLLSDRQLALLLGQFIGERAADLLGVRKLILVLVEPIESIVELV